ncbi:hypothetical protein K6119_16350 [Paracrocinitomix mangrovi]|uniref:hypothetical protein n=1 Tax=Paracrocinitomix mangrovi TaxID=2862509 RepID=UPI001C8E0B1F|nr:hypothetical protein [Paracrocinitomix mangrovi]UKN01300.1 hypothetical protein K6119_16350 [Paracrocinitomix mangrovi]
MKKAVVIIALILIGQMVFGFDKKQNFQTITVSKKTDLLNPINPFGEDLFGNKDKDKRPGKNRRIQRPVGINIGALGPGGIASASLDGFITPKIAIEAGAGLQSFEGDLSYFLGGRYHFFGKSRLNLTPYVGAYTAFHYNGRDVQNHSLYVPFGLHKIKKSGFNWSAEIAYQRSTLTDKNLHGAFKIGYRF